MNDDDLAVADLIFNGGAPLAWFDHPEFEDRWNLPWPFGARESARDIVLSMISRGYVETAPVDEAQREHVRLTRSGGVAWEAVRRPPWHLHVSESCRPLPSGRRWLSRAQAGSRATIAAFLDAQVSELGHDPRRRVKLVHVPKGRLVSWHEPEHAVSVAFISSTELPSPIAAVAPGGQRLWWTTARDLKVL